MLKLNIGKGRHVITALHDLESTVMLTTMEIMTIEIYACMHRLLCYTAIVTLMSAQCMHNLARDN